MNRAQHIIVFVFSMGILNTFYGQETIVKDRKPIVIIDPGHGGTDSGAIGVNGIKEKAIVLGIAKKIDSLNYFLFNNQLDIYLTRYKDTLISLGDRTKLAGKLKADVFISLHCNHAKNSRAKGVEVYVLDTEGIYLRQSIVLGYEIEKQLVSQISFMSRGVKFANFQVLRETINYCPSVLVEFGFLSNKDEAGYFENNQVFTALGLAILNSIIN